MRVIAKKSFATPRGGYRMGMTYDVDDATTAARWVRDGLVEPATAADSAMLEGSRPKRRGRPPGSKNKPKPEAATA